MTMQNKAGYVLCAAMAFMCAAAWGGENLIVNGNARIETGIYGTTPVDTSPDSPVP